MNLESKLQGLQSVGMQLATKARKAVDYILPFLDEYDAVGEAKSLLNDNDVRYMGLDVSEVKMYLTDSKVKYNVLFNLAKLADTFDRITSSVGIVAKTAALPGIISAIIAHVGEESIEFAAKLPFFLYLAHHKEHRHRIPGLLFRELGTSVIPVVGDAYDIITNLYMRTAYDIIRDDAKQNILSGSVPAPKLAVLGKVPSRYVG